MIENNLKSLQTQLKKLESEKQELRKVVSETTKLISQKDAKINEIKKLIQKQSEKETIISEHAILRYLERVEGIDLETIKQKILTSDIKNHMKVLGNNGKYKIDSTFYVVIKDNVVVTIEN
jgi:hypothetical protein